MAIIKCPECNQEISDKAPVCPSCGVPIAGHVTTCSQCGFTYFNSNAECPQCHHKTTVDNTTMCGDESDCKVNQKASGSRNNRIVIAVVSLVVVVLVLFYTLSIEMLKAIRRSLRMSSPFRATTPKCCKTI